MAVPTDRPYFEIDELDDEGESLSDLVDRKTYLLKKDTPELAKGTVVVEQCDDGDQGFKVHPLSKDLVSKHVDDDGVCFARNVVLKQPDWFEEVNVLVSLEVKKIRKKKK